jgi:hypothetical protein
MTKGEVSGLQALAKAHGGSLTINPDTGLAEAGFLSSILPMVVGAGLAATGVAPLMAAGIVGGGMGLATGSLSKGLMAGLGAYGGAGLAGGLMGAGAAAGAGAVGANMGAGAGSLAEQQAINAALAQNVAPAATAGLETAASGAGAAPSFYDQMGAYGNTSFPSNAAAVSPINAAAISPTITPAAYVPPAPTPELSFFDRLQAGGSQAMRGIESLGTSEGRDALLGKAASKGVEETGIGGLSGLAKYGGAAAAPLLMDSMQPKTTMPVRNSLQPFNYSYDPRRVEDPQAGYTGAASGQRTYFNPTFTRMAADGGLMDAGPVGAMSRANQPYMNPAYAAGGVSDAAVDAQTGAEKFAAGGISTLGGYSDGGQLLRGPNALESNGTSDSIPATIGQHQQPARLAEGEFVVPARIVSELGNGSTEAGAKQLYAMMDRVQKARAKTTGKNKVAVDAKARNLLPA